MSTQEANFLLQDFINKLNELEMEIELRDESIEAYRLMLESKVV